MNRTLGAVVASVLILIPAGRLRADDPTPESVVAKAVEALGGTEALKKAESLSWKSEGIVSVGGSDNDYSSEMTTQGLDHYRSRFEANFNGNQIEVVAVVTPEHGWIAFMDMVNELEGNALTDARRNLLIQVVPINPTLLKAGEYELKSAGTKKVSGKETHGVEFKPKGGEPITVYYDAETGLPARTVAIARGFGSGGVRAGGRLPLLQGGRRPVLPDQARGQARRRVLPGAGDHRVSRPGEGRPRDLREAEVSRVIGSRRGPGGRRRSPAPGLRRRRPDGGRPPGFARSRPAPAASSRLRP